MKTGRFFYSLLAVVLLCAVSFVNAQENSADAAETATYKITRTNNLGTLKTVTRYDRALPVSAPLQVRWALPMDSKIRRIHMPSQNNGLLSLVVETEGNDLIAVRRDNGEALWWLKLQKPLLGDMFFGQHYMLFVTDGRAVCLERVSGDLVWNVNLPFAPAAGPTAAEDGPDTLVVVVPGLDKAVYAFDVTEEAWPNKDNPAFKGDRKFSVTLNYYRPRWSFVTSGVVNANPMYNNGMVFAGGWGKDVYGLSINSKTFNGQPNFYWNHRVRAACVASPVAEGPNVLFPSTDHVLYCLTNRDGGTIWRYIAEDELLTSPQVFRDVNLEKNYVLQKVGKNGPLVTLNPVGGKPLWQLANADLVVGKFEARGKKREMRTLVVCANAAGKIQAVQVSAPDTRSAKEKQKDAERQTPRAATVLWSLDTPFTNFVANCYENSVFCVGNEGRVLYALEEND